MINGIKMRKQNQIQCPRRSSAEGEQVGILNQETAITDGQGNTGVKGRCMGISCGPAF